jgi:hypothetical protein
MKRDEPKSLTAVHGSSVITYHPKKKANAIADCAENRFTSHDLCDENHELEVEAEVQALLASVKDTPLRIIKPCDLHNLADSLKLRKACGFEGIPKECLRHLPRTTLTGTSDTMVESVPSVVPFSKA